MHTRLLHVIELKTCVLPFSVECIEAVDCFNFYVYHNQACPVGQNIHHILEELCIKFQQAMEAELKAVSIKDIANETKNLIVSQ